MDCGRFGMLNNRMSDIKELASLIKQLAKTYTCQPLDLYADHLDEAARSYNSKKIRELLGEFPGLIDNLTKAQGKGVMIKLIKNNSQCSLFDQSGPPRSMWESAVRGFELGAADYIRKPLNLMELLARVRTHIELKQLRLKLEKEASVDPLTSLLNRRGILQRIEYEQARHIRNATVFSIILVDVDFFKPINDNYGHDCGDLVLKTVSQRLRDHVRRLDSAARWGGDEFLILLPETQIEGAKVLAEKLRRLVEETSFVFHSNSIRLSITLGVSDCQRCPEGRTS